jgi:hypothetical protein
MAPVVMAPSVRANQGPYWFDPGRGFSFWGHKVRLYMAAEPTPDESEGLRLHDEYKRAVERYRWAVNEVTRQRGTTHLEDYDRLMRYAEETRVEALAARRALDRLKSEHPPSVT